MGCRRTFFAWALIASLAACQTGSSGQSPASRSDEADLTPASVSTQGSSDRRVAKQVFGAISTPSNQPPASFGGYARGCQAGAVQLPETGPTWQAMRLSRNRNWSQPATVQFVEDLSAFAATQPGWAGLYVGDMSQPRGGPMLTGHASHQTGLDADIWMLPPSRLTLTRAEREEISSIQMDRTNGAYATAAFTPQHMAILRHAAEDPRVARIFLFAGGKVALCNAATGDRAWLNKIRPWSGHNYHFHVRLHCPAGQRGCEEQAPPPPGDGCADAQAWVNNILNPPPPDPNAPPPPPARGPLLVSELPGQCAAVLEQD